MIKFMEIYFARMKEINTDCCVYIKCLGLSEENSASYKYVKSFNLKLKLLKSYIFQSFWQNTFLMISNRGYLTWNHSRVLHYVV